MFSLALHGQTTTVQVVTKTIAETFPLRDKASLQVTGHKADIKIIGWQKSEILLEARLISKALTQEIALRELEHQEMLSEYIGNTLYVRNAIVRPSAKENFEALLTAEITLRVPHYMQIELTALYKSIHLEGLSGKVTVQQEYGDLRLQDLSGSTDLEVSFADVTMEQCSGKYEMNLRYTPLTIEQSAAEVEITSELGDIEIVDASRLARLKINGEKSNIHIQNQGELNHSIRARVKYGSLVIDGEQINLEGNEWASNQGRDPAWNLATKFGDITIKTN